jgi:LAO/AO transport system kinase
VASQDIGIEELEEAIQKHSTFISSNAERKIHMMTEKAYQLIQQKRMKNIDKIDLFKLIKSKMNCHNVLIF